MNTDDLRKSLKRLRTELGRAAGLDEDSRRSVQQILQDVEKTQTGTEPHSRLQRLEALTVQFEVNHPTLGAALRELMERLAQAGV